MKEQMIQKLKKAGFEVRMVPMVVVREQAYYGCPQSMTEELISVEEAYRKLESKLDSQKE